MPRAGGLARPRPTRRGDRLHRVGRGGDRHQAECRRADGGPAGPGRRGATTGTGTTSGPGCWSWSGRTRHSTPGTGSPTRWRRRAACPCSPTPAPGRAASPGRRSRPHRSTSPSSCRVGSTSRAQWRRPPRSWPVPRSAELGRIVAVDANAYFSRPGPRVVDGVELLEELLHGDAGLRPSRSAGPAPLTGSARSGRPVRPLAQTGTLATRCPTLWFLDRWRFVRA